MTTNSSTAATSGDDDGMRALVERWVERAERRLKAHPRSAPPEPTRGRAADEAIAMAGFLLASDGVVRRARP
jgi:hypothetical protein